MIREEYWRLRMTDPGQAAFHNHQRPASKEGSYLTNLCLRGPWGHETKSQQRLPEEEMPSSEGSTTRRLTMTEMRLACGLCVSSKDPAKITEGGVDIGRRDTPVQITACKRCGLPNKPTRPAQSTLSVPGACGRPIVSVGYVLRFKTRLWKSQTERETRAREVFGPLNSCWVLGSWSARLARLFVALQTTLEVLAQLEPKATPFHLCTPLHPPTDTPRVARGSVPQTLSPRASEGPCIDSICRDMRKVNDLVSCC